MSLYIVRDGERFLWVAAVLGEEVYCYVPDLGTFHRNDGLRDDYFMDRDLQYERIAVARAQELLRGGLQPLDAEVMADHLAEWREDPGALAPEQVFASVVADLR